MAKEIPEKQQEIIDASFYENIALKPETLLGLFTTTKFVRVFAHLFAEYGGQGVRLQADANHYLIVSSEGSQIHECNVDSHTFVNDLAHLVAALNTPSQIDIRVWDHPVLCRLMAVEGVFQDWFEIPANSTDYIEGRWLGGEIKNAGAGNNARIQVRWWSRTVT